MAAYFEKRQLIRAFDEEGNRCAKQAALDEEGNGCTRLRFTWIARFYLRGPLRTLIYIDEVQKPGGTH